MTNRRNHFPYTGIATFVLRVHDRRMQSVCASGPLLGGLIEEEPSTLASEPQEHESIEIESGLLRRRATVLVHTKEGQVLPLEMDEDERVEQLKRKIHEEEPFWTTLNPLFSQRRLFTDKGTEMLDGRRVTSYAVGENATVSLILDRFASIRGVCVVIELFLQISHICGLASSRDPCTPCIVCASMRHRRIAVHCGVRPNVVLPAMERRSRYLPDASRSLHSSSTRKAAWCCRDAVIRHRGRLRPSVLR